MTQVPQVIQGMLEEEQPALPYPPNTSQLDDVLPDLNLPLNASKPTVLWTDVKALTEIGLFKLAHQHQAYLRAPFVLADTAISLPSALLQSYGAVHSQDATGTVRDGSSIHKARPYAGAGRNRLDAPKAVTITDTSVQDVVLRRTELKNALSLRRSRAHTPLKAEAWLDLLSTTGLIARYPYLPQYILKGFHAGIKPILRTFTPPNNPSIYILNDIFQDIVQTEYIRGRYIGPLSKQEIEYEIGPFQTSPLSLVDKPGKPNQYRLIQNLSFPHTPRSLVTSINHNIDSDLYPCTWGTFSTICLLVSQLPPGSQGACRDVSEAYRTIPLEPSQWPGTVVRLSEDDSFALNTSNSFGLRAAGGIYGMVGDAGADILRASGIGPLCKWVDDHLFIRILKQHLPAYNQQRLECHNRITVQGGCHHNGGRLWYGGNILPDGRVEEFDEDMLHPMRDLSQNDPRSTEDKAYTYCFADIDTLMDKLGIPWELSKDVAFDTSVPFIGLLWDLQAKTVSLPDKKKAKYLAAILDWNSRRTHNLQHVQKLYGKLLHVCLVLPRGRAYIMGLEALLGCFHDMLFKPRTPPAGTSAELLWWQDILSKPNISRSIPGVGELRDIGAYSDASSSVGIGVVIGDKWRAWRLVPGWKADSRDIGWAEAISFKFLSRIILQLAPEPSNFKVYGDNTGVVEGWWKGRSRNVQTNQVFRRIHELLEDSGSRIHTRYVASKLNPADGPSRGIYPPLQFLLPLIDIPCDLTHLVIDFNAPTLPIEERLHRQNCLPQPISKFSDDHAYERTASTCFEQERRGQELFQKNTPWDN